jgi:hypothetical protein
LSLQQLLVAGHATLSQREQYDLSITLASSLLQLGRTPWLQRVWSRKDILFHRGNPRQSSSSLTVDVNQPFLARLDPAGNLGLADDWHNASNFLGLGVMFVEILSGRPIEHFCKNDDLGPDGQRNEFTNLQIIRTWLREQERAGAISLGFRSAIGHCLRCFAAPEASVANDEFARAAQEEIIAPLEQEMACLFIR